MTQALHANTHVFNFHSDHATMSNHNQCYLYISIETVWEIPSHYKQEHIIGLEAQRAQVAS